MSLGLRLPSRICPRVQPNRTRYSSQRYHYRHRRRKRHPRSASTPRTTRDLRRNRNDSVDIHVPQRDDRSVEQLPRYCYRKCEYGDNHDKRVCGTKHRSCVAEQRLRGTKGYGPTGALGRCCCRVWDVDVSTARWHYEFSLLRPITKYHEAALVVLIAMMDVVQWTLSSYSLRMN